MNLVTIEENKLAIEMSVNTVSTEEPHNIRHRATLGQFQTGEAVTRKIQRFNRVHNIATLRVIDSGLSLIQVPGASGQKTLYASYAKGWDTTVPEFEPDHGVFTAIDEQRAIRVVNRILSVDASPAHAMLQLDERMIVRWQIYASMSLSSLAIWPFLHGVIANASIEGLPCPLILMVVLCQ